MADSKKRTLDAFFKPPPKKTKIASDDDDTKQSHGRDEVSLPEAVLLSH